MSALSKLPQAGRDAATAFAQVTRWPAEEWAIALQLLLDYDPNGVVRADQVLQLSVRLDTEGAADPSPSAVTIWMLKQAYDYLPGHVRGDTSKTE